MSSYDSGSHVRPDITGFQATAMDMSFDEKYLFATSNITNTFRVYKYTESTNVWTQEYSTTGASGFGQDVSCTWDGDIAIVGSPLENKAYAYKSDPQAVNIWSSPTTTTIERNAATLLYSSSHTPSTNFGYSVSLSKNDGNFLAIGAPGDSTPSDHGEAWVLYLHSSTNNQLVYKVRTSNSGGYTLYNNNLFTPTYPVVNEGTDYYYITTSGHRIGHSVHISSYGEYLAIGAPGTPVDSIRGSNWFDQTVTNIQHVTTGTVFNDSETRSSDDYLQSIAMLGHIQVLYSTDSWNTMTQTDFITGNSEQDLQDITLLSLTGANAWDFPSCGEKVKISTDGTYVFGGSPRYGFPGSQGGAHWGKIESWKREGSKMILSPGRVIGQQPGDRLGKYFDIDFSGNRLACLLLKAPSSYATPYGNFQGGLMVYDFNGLAFFETTEEITDTVGENGNVHGLHGAICMSRGNTTIVSAINGSSATGLIPSFYFKLTQTIDGNTLSGGYLAADTIVVGPNDGTTNNSYPKKLSFGGTYRDNSYENTQIENRIYHYDSTNYSEWEQGYSELIFRKKSQREAQDMIRFKSNEFRIDSYINADGDYDHYPVLTVNQQGLVKLNAEMHIPDNTSVHITSEMQCNAKALLDIEGDCFTRRRVNIGWPEGQNVYGSDKWSWKIIYDTRSPRIFNFENSNQIHSNLIAINNTPWVGKFRGDSYGTISNDFRYSETECAFYMHTSSSYSTNDNYNTSGTGHTISFWFKLTTPQSSLTSNETLMTIGTPSSTANNGMKLELSSTTISMNFGTHTIGSSRNFDTNKWYHVYIDFDDDNGTNNAMYINGNGYTNITTGTQPSTTNWTTQFTIGSTDGDSITDCYIGMIAYGYKNPSGAGGGGGINLPTIQDMYKWGPPTQRLIVGGDTIINNHLGIGTVLPAYNLDVVGDINLTGNIYQNGGSFYASPWIINDTIPNTPMTSSSSGGYTISSSNVWTGYEEWRAFNGTVGSDAWATYQTYQGNSSGVSVHINGVSTTYNGSSSVLGEWIQIQVPTSLITNKIDIAPFSTYTNYSPRSGKLLGSNDGTTWTLIHSFTGQTYTEGQYTIISFSNSVAYSYFRLVCEDIEAFNRYIDHRTGNTVYSYYRVYIGEFRIYTIYPDICYNNANVGIGTISPAHPLDVTGNMRLTGGLYVNGSWGASGQVLTSSGGGVMSWTTVSGGGGGGSSVWTVNGTYAYYNTGNVGIGISTPAYELDVVGDINISSGSRFRINGVAQTFDIDSNNTFTIKTANTERFRIDSNGDTTIGQDNDIGTGHRLTIVDGSTSNDGSYADLVITNMNEHNNARLLLGTPYNIDSTSAFKAAIIADGAGSYSRCDLHFCLDQSTNNTVNADINDSKMVIKYDTGNVGIGTTGPGYKLDVNGDINMSTGSSFRINGVAQTFVGASSQWTQSGSDIYRPSGMVGILNTNPSYPLDVTGDINVTGGLHANGAAGTSGQVLTSSGGGAMSWTNKIWSYATVTSHPTVTMTSASTSGYVASASSSVGSGPAYYAFNNIIGAESWYDGNWSYTGSPTGTYTGSISTTYNGSTTVDGEWIQLQVPTSITIDSIKIAPQNFRSLNAPTEGKILGSTNGSTWTLIHSFTGQTYTDGQYTTISFSNSVAYSYFRLCVERTGGGFGAGSGACKIGELKFNKAVDTYYSGNVGIGTISPAHPLDVVGNINCTGTLSKGSGSFKIDHPLPNMSNTHNLYHSFIEGPKADLIYRGKVDLENGSASINLDTVSKMTSGTFEALNRNVQCFTTNESDWDAVKGSVSGNMLTISCQNTSSTANVSWLIIGERKDQHMYDTNWTDSDGYVVPEQLK